MWVKHATKEVRMGFVRKVYTILSLQLLLTAAIAAPLQQMNEEWLASNAWICGLSIVVTMTTVLVMSLCKGVARSYPMNYILLFFFTAFEGVLVGFISAAYTSGSAALCLGITAVIFLSLTTYAWTAKTDFTELGPCLFGMLLSMLVSGIMVGLMAAVGVYTQWMHALYDIVGILTFIIYVIFDTQLIMGEMGGHKKQFSVDDYVFAALNIYLDLINLFIKLLRLLGKQKK